MKAVIITSDTPRALGLRGILNQYFDIDTVILRPGKDILPELDDEETPSTIYIVDSEVYYSVGDFFIPRRSRIVVIGSQPGMFAMNQSEGDLVEELRGRLDDMSAVVVEQSAPGLSQREVEVLRHIALGHLNKEIADALGISINTVLSHRKNITPKLGIRSASGLSVYAMMNGYL